MGVAVMVNYRKIRQLGGRPPSLKTKEKSGQPVNSAAGAARLNHADFGVLTVQRPLAVKLPAVRFGAKFQMPGKFRDSSGPAKFALGIKAMNPVELRHGDVHEHSSAYHKGDLK